MFPDEGAEARYESQRVRNYLGVGAE